MLWGPMADYPHASAACLCYLDEREGGEEREGKDAGHLTFSLFFSAFPLDWPRCPAGYLKLARERKGTREGEERGRAVQKVPSRSWTSP